VPSEVELIVQKYVDGGEMVAEGSIIRLFKFLIN